MTTGDGRRVLSILIVAPEGRDAKVISQVLASDGLEPEVCADVAGLLARIDTADAAFLTEESLQHQQPQLTTWVQQQAPWSDFPFVVLVARRHGRRSNEALEALVRLGNVVLLERPLNAETLLTAARSALRSRSRQYAARQQLQEEAELRCVEERSRTAATHAAQALAVAVESGELGTFHCPLPMSQIDCSPRCRVHLGLTAEMAIDLPTLLRRVHKDDVSSVRHAFFDNSDSQPDSREVELRVAGPDGTTRWVRAKGRVYRDSKGTPTRFDGVTLDVTQQKLLAQEREALLIAERDARREAERAGRMKDEFIATLSHELRTPLSAILGWTHILQRGGAANVSRAAMTIERNARAQAQLIDDLLDVSRITSGNFRLEHQQVSLPSVLEAVQQMLRPTFEAKQVAVSVEPDSWRGNLRADPSRLQQIVWNLVANAIKFTPAGGGVQIGARREGAHVVVQVSDTGIGIEADFLPHVFDRFRQAESSAARTYGGLGLGLAIVRQLVEMHGGSVAAASPGKGLGSSFVIRLPIGVADPLESPSPHTTEPSIPLQSGVLSGVRVLVVDDEEDNREMIAILLRSDGASVDTAASAEHALARLAQASVDVLISDIGMPHTDGYALIRSVRTSESPWNKIPALALTAFAGPGDAANARRAGFDAHLAKPVDPATLAASVTALAGSAASRY